MMGVIRKTKSIELILDEFSKDTNAISATELINRLDSKMNKTTIYRILERLEDDGVVHSFLDKSGSKWFAKCQSCSSAGHFDAHPHFQCVSCGNIDCLPTTVPIPEIPNRTIDVVQVLIQGTCDACYVA